MTSPRKLRFSSQSKGILNPQPSPRPWNKSRRGSRRKRQPKIPYKYVGVYLKELPAFICIDIESHKKAKTIRKLKNNTIEVKIKSKNTTKFIKGLIIAHGGK